MFLASGSDFVEAKGFKGVGRGDWDSLGDIIFKIQGDFDVGKDADEEISIWERGGSTHVGYATHVINYNQGTIYRVAIHKTIDGFKRNFIVGLFRVLWGKRSEQRHSEASEVLESGHDRMVFCFGVRRFPFFCDQAQWTRDKSLATFWVKDGGAVSINLRPNTISRTE